MAAQVENDRGLRAKHIWIKGCTIANLGDAAQFDILASAGLELTLLLSSILYVGDFLDSGEGWCGARKYASGGVCG